MDSENKYQSRQFGKRAFAGMKAPMESKDYRITVEYIITNSGCDTPEVCKQMIEDEGNVIGLVDDPIGTIKKVEKL